VQCALCRIKDCVKGKNCSVIKYGLEYTGDDLKAIQISAWLESDSMKRTKLEEIAIYAKSLGYTKIGIAFCFQDILKCFQFAVKYVASKKPA
jgi:uncharacterized metal-binding protein